LNQQSIANDLAGRFGQIDLQAQQQNFSNMQNALGAQGTGAQTMAQVGAGQQLQAQNQADAAFKGLSQLASVYGGVMPKETKTVEKNTGGK